MSAIGVLHEKLVFNRRVETLAGWFAQLAPPSARVLDVGCGDGLISAVLLSRRPDLSLRGIDVLPRSRTHIPVEMFDGSRIPFDDQSFDAVLFSDVLHHTPHPAALLREARRVAAHCVLIKDHNRNGLAAGARLRFMDWVGSASCAPHGTKSAFTQSSSSPISVCILCPLIGFSEQNSTS